jgi:hypothetical protein
MAAHCSGVKVKWTFQTAVALKSSEGFCGATAGRVAGWDVTEVTAAASIAIREERKSAGRERGLGIEVIVAPGG